MTEDVDIAFKFLPVKIRSEFVIAASLPGRITNSNTGGVDDIHMYYLYNIHIIQIIYQAYAGLGYAKPSNLQHSLKPFVATFRI